MVISNNDRPKKTSPLIVELIGPAGAGKTTISRALGELDDRVVIGAEIELRKMEHIPIFIAYAPFLWPVSLSRFLFNRWFSWDEIKAMAYLKGWPFVLKHMVGRGADTILLDHGPIFKMATLAEFGPEKFIDHDFGNWWSKIFKQWAALLDIVIWLDAPDTILQERIDARSQKHTIKYKSEREAREFLKRYRKSYQFVLAKLAAHGGPALLHFDTSQMPMEQIMEQVQMVFNTALSGNRNEVHRVITVDGSRYVRKNIRDFAQDNDKL